MTDPAPSPPAWGDAVLAATIFAVAPAATGGVVVRAQPGPARDRWLALMRAGLPRTAPVRRVPVRIADDRLLGGLDLAATLRAGRPMAERGILAACDGGVAVLAMAERLEAGTAARIAAVLDCGQVQICRDGVVQRQAARLGLVALDEGLEADERVSPALADRMAFRIDLTSVAWHAVAPPLDPWRLADARVRLPEVRSDERLLEALCSVALGLGIASVRAPLLALQAARAHAALGGRTCVTEADALVATRLVLAPRATQIPVPPAAEPEGEDSKPPDGEAERGAAAQNGELETTQATDSLAESLVEAARAVLPPGVLAALASPSLARPGNNGAQTGASRPSQRHGRPAGSRRGDPRGGARLHLIETLKAAAPWQAIRRQAHAPGGRDERIQVRRADFRIRRFKQRAASTTIFLVDASGSTAAQRLAEAKGAVELLLAECYVRRDQVALLTFRGTTADILLPPTRSLSRAKRCLAGLPGGGGTPLATAIAAGALMAELVRRAGQSPALVVLTDGRANITRDGRNERPRAEAEALAAARVLRAAAIAAVLIDTSQHPRPVARELAQAMGARYLPLPRADAAALSHAVRAATQARTGESQSALRR